MNKTDKHTIQSRFALLLLVVFVGSLFIKPVHVLLAHHDLSDGICTTDHCQAVTTDHCTDCPICEFEFCTFIPQTQTGILQITVIVQNEQTRPTVDGLVSISTHLFQLRAPPVF